MVEMVRTNKYVVNLMYSYKIRCEDGALNLLDWNDKVVIEDIERFSLVEMESKIYLFLKTKLKSTYYIYEISLKGMKQLFMIRLKSDNAMDNFYIGIKSKFDECLIKLNDFTQILVPNKKTYPDNKIKEYILELQKEKNCDLGILVYGSTFDFIDYTNLFSGIII